MKNNKLIALIAGGIAIIFIGVVVFILTLPKYKCPDSTYKLKNKRCIKTEESSPYQKLICPEGLVVEENHCVKISSEKASYNYKCPSGYTRVDQMCQKTLTAEQSYYYFCGGKRTEEKSCDSYKKPKVDYGTGQTYCEEGKLEGSNCVISRAPTRKKDCPTGYSRAGKICQKVVTEAASLSYSCKENYTLNGKMCETREYQDGKWETACKEGFTLSGDKCIRNINIAATKK